jgi:hypothetical protein
MLHGTSAARFAGRLPRISLQISGHFGLQATTVYSCHDTRRSQNVGPPRGSAILGLERTNPTIRGRPREPQGTGGSCRRECGPRAEDCRRRAARPPVDARRSRGQG